MKKATGIFAVILFFFSILLLSCGSSAHIEKDPSVDFSKYKNYAWITKPLNDSSGSNDLIENAVKNVVNGELQKLTGWTLVNNKPDLLLNYDVLVERSVREKSDPIYSRSYVRTFYNPRTRRYFNIYYPSRFIGYENYGVQVMEGTVTISMIDTKTDKMVWQGWTTEEIDSRRIQTKEVESAIKSIFKKFSLAKTD